MTAGSARNDDDDRQALLELLLAEEGIAPAAPAPIPKRPPFDEPVLSRAQERLWFLQQLEEDTAALNIRAALRLTGPLDHDALRAALDDVVVRHESLRTNLTSESGTPRPSVAERFATPFYVDDVRGEADPDQRAAAILADEAAHRFDLERDLPLRVRLVQLRDDEHVLSLIVHHVAADGWSVGIILRDLAALYGERTGGRPAGLPALPVDYASYAAWQREVVRGDQLDRQLAHWRTSLRAPLPLCEIPPDYMRPAQHTFAGGQLGQTLGPELTTALNDLARRCGATLFMTLLAGFDLVLARHIDLDDVIVGTPVAGRVRPELEPMVGMFLNMLALRVDTGGDPTFTELVGRVRDVSLGAFDNQEVSFEELLADLRPTRDVSRTPLFQVLFNMMSFGAGDVTASFAGLRAEVLAQPELDSKFDITLYAGERDGSCELLMVYNRALYRPETMRQLLEQYVTVLRAVAADPTRPIHDYSLRTHEAEMLLPSENEPLDASWHGTVVDALRRRAAENPDAPAIVDASRTVTYAQLVERVDGVASWIHRNGVIVGQVTAVHAFRSPALVWTVLGILASGASYVLLDPAYPPARLAQYVRGARPAAWLAVPGAGPVPAEVLAALDEVGVGIRATVDDWPDPGPGDRADVDIGPDHVACLTYTSGSTGTPKAVVGRHGSLTHFLPWQTERFGITSADRFSMLSGLAHDPLQRDMFWPIWAGATIVVPDPDQIATPGWLAEWFEHEQITVSHLTPAMGRLLTEHGYPGETPLLRHAFFIGDVLPRRDVARLRELAPDVEVVEPLRNDGDPAGEWLPRRRRRRRGIRCRHRTAGDPPRRHRDPRHAAARAVGERIARGVWRDRRDLGPQPPSRRGLPRSARRNGNTVRRLRRLGRPRLPHRRSRTVPL